MKKIIILVIIVLGLIGGVGGYLISNNKIANNPKQIIVNSATSNNTKSLINPNNELNTKSSTFSNTNNESNIQIQNNINNESNTKKSTIKNVNSEDDAQAQRQGDTTISSNIINKNNIEANGNNTNNTNSASNKNFGIQWVLGKNQNSTTNTIVIRNNTGEKISNKQLVQYIKNWILNAQINYSQGCAATMWVPEFFNVVPDNDLVQAFINSNGEEALSKSITAGELGNTNIELMKLVSENQPLLTQSQIFEYIYQHILPKNQISKIENQRYSYLIYSKTYGNHILYNSLDKYTGATAC